MHFCSFELNQDQNLSEFNRKLRTETVPKFLKCMLFPIWYVRIDPGSETRMDPLPVALLMVMFGAKLNFHISCLTGHKHCTNRITSHIKKKGFWFIKVLEVTFLLCMWEVIWLFCFIMAQSNMNSFSARAIRVLNNSSAPWLDNMFPGSDVDWLFECWAAAIFTVSQFSHKFL